jgi:LPXTG-site transpeptidase (sortase) family protein
MRSIPKKAISILALILLACLTFATSVNAATLCVEPSGAGGCYTTIQAAINAASDGDTISVLAGNYAENVVIDRAVTLSGAGTASAFIQPATGPAIALRSPSGTLTGVTISGFYLKGSNGILIDKNWWGGVEALSIQDLTISNVYLFNNTAHGLIINNGAVVNGLEIDLSYFSGNTQTGISISNSATKVSNVQISRSLITNNKQVGLYLLGPEINNLTLNVVSIGSNGYEGILIDNAAKITDLVLQSTNIYGSGSITASRGIGLGISLSGTAVDGLQIIDSNINSNNYHGMYIDRAALSTFSILNSSIRDNAWEGIHIRGSANLTNFTFAGGEIITNSGFGFLVRPGTGGTPIITNLVIDDVEISDNKNSGLALIGTLNGSNIIRNSSFGNNAWEDLDIGVGWIGTTTINDSLLVSGNTFYGTTSWTGAYVDAAVSGVANLFITQNCFNRTGWGLFNSNVGQVNAVYNWWNSVDGPNTTGTLVGGPVTFTPWSTSSGVCSSPVILYDLITEPADGAVLASGPTQITIEFNKDVISDGSLDAADNVVNYLLVEAGANGTFDTIECAGGLIADDTQLSVDNAAYDNNGLAGPYVSTLDINGGIPLPAGDYRLYVCGSTSILDLANNPLNNGIDMDLNFTVLPVAASSTLPATGFPQGLVTALPAQSDEKAYEASEMILEIPALDVEAAIVGVPQSAEGWDTTWLGQNAGYLYGSAFPTWAGNTVITGHVWDNNNHPGPFANLKNLKYGDQIEILAFGQIYTYEVRDSNLVSIRNTAKVFQHEDYDWLTLMTCEFYNPLTQNYMFRRVVRAVLIEVTQQ